MMRRGPLARELHYILLILYMPSLGGDHSCHALVHGQCKLLQDLKDEIFSFGEL